MNMGSDVGTSTRADFGSTTTTTETDQNGTKKPITSEQLKIGDAQFVVNTGTNFAGQTLNNAALTTGAAVTTRE